MFFEKVVKTYLTKGSSLPAQSIFDEKEHKVFLEIENWKNTVISKLSVTGNRPDVTQDPISGNAFSPFGKEIKGTLFLIITTFVRFCFLGNVTNNVF